MKLAALLLLIMPPTMLLAAVTTTILVGFFGNVYGFPLDEVRRVVVGLIPLSALIALYYVCPWVIGKYNNR